MEQDFSMHANPLVAKLQKPASEFTKADIVSYICLLYTSPSPRDRG